jgi:Protein of unknown function (DUF2877)
VGRPFPVAASAAVELALVGPPRPATVVASTPHATYLAVADAEETMICLASASAVRVPCAVILESKSLPPQVPVGTIATVGAGSLSLEGAVFRVSRWWRPPRPRGLGGTAPARVSAAVRWLTGRVADPLDNHGRAAVADLVLALSTGASPGPAVARLLGRGPGLTPTGDDVLAGALVSLTALGAPAARSLAAAVTASAPDATTTVSVALLRHAARGECIPQLADLLDAVAHGESTLDSLPAARASLPRAAGALLAVGHCSGAGLLHGVLVGFAIAHSRVAHQVSPVSADVLTGAASPVSAAAGSPVSAAAA